MAAFKLPVFVVWKYLLSAQKPRSPRVHLDGVCCHTCCLHYFLPFFLSFSSKLDSCIALSSAIQLKGIVEASHLCFLIGYSKCKVLHSCFSQCFFFVCVSFSFFPPHFTFQTVRKHILS